MNIQEKKQEVLNGLFKSKDKLSWNETSELLNELIEIAAKPNLKLNLRWIRRASTSTKFIGNYHVETVLQQEFKNEDGESEWRDIPIVND